ncbi:hypothetical protein BH10ACI1_BH10ACI1_12340 [soil metagenome]
MLTGIIIALVVSLIIGGIKAIAGSGQPKNNFIPNQPNYPAVYEMPVGVVALPMYINKNNQQLGPYSPEQVLSMLNSGQLSAFDMAIRQGDSQWQPLSSYFIARQMR